VPLDPEEPDVPDDPLDPPCAIKFQLGLLSGGGTIEILEFVNEI
jgi:hypothetical protein